MQPQLTPKQQRLLGYFQREIAKTGLCPSLRQAAAELGVSHPAIAQIAVIGIPHDTWGEQVHAIVVLKAGAEATAEEIISYARESIAGYKVPKSVEFRSEPLPLSGAMKVLKRELREPYWQGHKRRVN